MGLFANIAADSDMCSGQKCKETEVKKLKFFAGLALVAVLVFFVSFSIARAADSAINLSIAKQLNYGWEPVGDGQVVFDRDEDYVPYLTVSGSLGQVYPTHAFKYVWVSVADQCDATMNTVKYTVGGRSFSIDASEQLPLGAEVCVKVKASLAKPSGKNAFYVHFTTYGDGCIPIGYNPGEGFVFVPECDETCYLMELELPFLPPTGNDN